jgi:hypothetical protein
MFVRRLDRPINSSFAFETLFSREEAAVWLDSSLLAGSLSITRGGEVEKSDEDLFDYLKRTLAARQVDTPALPFQFTCG